MARNALCLFILLHVAMLPGLAKSAEEQVTAAKQVELKQGTIPFFDIQIAYKLYDVINPGPEEAERLNPTAVFLHGAKYSSDFWLQQGTLQMVTESGVRALAVDLPGYGATPALPYSDNNMRAEVIKAIVEFAWPVVNSTVILISPSMSGRYSIPFLDRYGTMLASYVAVAPIGMKDWGGPWEDTHKRVCALAVYGNQDALVGDAERVVRLFEHAFKVVIPGAGHRSYEDKPRAFNAALLRFLGKCRRTVDSGFHVEPEEKARLVSTLNDIQKGKI